MDWQASIAKAIEALPPERRNPAPLVETVDRARAMHRWGLPVLYGGMMADAMTTAVALQRPNIREANPLMEPLGLAGILAAKGAANGFAGWALDKAAHRGSRWATLAAISLGVAQGIAAVHNMRVIRQ
jgi:hypothetical protein